MENRINIKDGLIKQNMVFMSGMLIAPVIACASTLMKSLAVCFVFSFVSAAAIFACRRIPRTIVYTLRVIIYSLAAAVAYIPAMLLAELIFGQDIVTSAGVYLPILITNSLILSKTETRFYHEPLKNMAADVFMFILGFDGACIVTGIIRELLADSSIAGYGVDMPFTVPALETTFGGFLFVGVGAGLFRWLYNRSKRKALEQPEEGEESLAEYAEDMGEFLIGKHKTEKIKIYKAAAKKAKQENSLLDLEFLSNKDILDEFAAIVAEGEEMLSPERKVEKPEESGEEGKETAEIAEDNSVTADESSPAKLPAKEEEQPAKEETEE